MLRKNNIVENIHIPPFPDDTGLSFGAAALGAFKNKDVVNYHIIFLCLVKLMMKRKLRRQC